MTAPLLDVKDLRVSFGGKEVVHGIGFHIQPGEKLALVGESGSGKTVSALSLLGLVPNARVTGSAVLQGEGNQAPRDLMQISERELLGIRGREIAMIVQEPMTALNPLYTVGDQVAEVLEVKEGLSKREAWQSAVEALRATGAKTKREAIVAAIQDFNRRRRMAELVKHAGTCENMMSVEELQKQRRRG